MNQQPSVPELRQKQELQIPFPLVKKLFDFAKESGLDDSGYSEYLKDDTQEGEVNSKAVLLPEKFSSIVTGLPGVYYLVGYEDRSGEYFSKESRGKNLMISNSSFKSKSNERLIEVSIKAPDISQGKGNVVYVSVSNSINEENFRNVNGEVPHGSAEITYKINADGTKTQSFFEADRFDESSFILEEGEKKVRWVRNLNINKELKIPITSYRDSYLIGSNQWGVPENVVEVRLEVAGFLVNPESVKIDIGIGSEETAEVLFEDKDKNIKILLHKPTLNTFEPLKVLKQDPGYSFLFESPFNVEKMLDILKLKIKSLENDWDKTQNIFSTPNAITNTPSQLENKLS